MDQIRKIKYDGETLTVVSRDEGQKWERDETFTSREVPHPDFVRALNALKTDVLHICELDRSYGQSMAVRGVSFSYDADGNRGATVTALKELSDIPAPLVINTPHVSERETEHTEATMSTSLRDALDDLIRETVAFVEGEKRAQGSLLDSIESVTLEREPAGAA